MQMSVNLRRFAVRSPLGSDPGAEIHWGDKTGIYNQNQIGRGYASKGRTPARKQRAGREQINMMSTVTNQAKVRFMFYKETMYVGRKSFPIFDNMRAHHAKLIRK